MPERTITANCFALLPCGSTPSSVPNGFLLRGQHSSDDSGDGESIDVCLEHSLGGLRLRMSALAQRHLHSPRRPCHSVRCSPSWRGRRRDRLALRRVCWKHNTSHRRQKRDTRENNSKDQNAYELQHMFSLYTFECTHEGKVLSGLKDFARCGPAIAYQIGQPNPAICVPDASQSRHRSDPRFKRRNAL